MRSAAIFIALLAVCSPFVWSAARAHDAPPAAKTRPLAAGLWGGDHVRMTVSDVGARLEYDCAESTIDEPIVLDARGKFTARGTYAPERGGPRRDRDAAAGRARYTGEVRGDRMRLTVTVGDAKEPVGVFTLRRGNDPLLTKCR